MLAALVANDVQKGGEEENAAERPEEAATITVGVPLRGMLLWKGRTLPPEWYCAVCKVTNDASRALLQSGLALR